MDYLRMLSNFTSDEFVKKIRKEKKAIKLEKLLRNINENIVDDSKIKFCEGTLLQKILLRIFLIRKLKN